MEFRRNAKKNLFTGLRIAEVILRNPQLRTGRNETPFLFLSGYKGPLLCICYTNHALDQFLEGILKIMDTHDMDPKIVRVGGRSKSETLKEFNLRDIARRTTRRADGLLWREKKDIEVKIKQNEVSIKNRKQIIEELERPTGMYETKSSKMTNFFKLFLFQESYNFKKSMTLSTKCYASNSHTN